MRGERKLEGEAGSADGAMAEEKREKDTALFSSDCREDVSSSVDEVEKDGSAEAMREEADCGDRGSDSGDTEGGCSFCLTSCALYS
jgi:hypothetical protein